MTYSIKLSARAKRSLRKLAHSGTFKKEKLEKALTCLENGVPLPSSYTDHALSGALSNFRECHLGFDLLLLYSRTEKPNTIIIVAIGTHTELFGE